MQCSAGLNQLLASFTFLTFDIQVVDLCLDLLYTQLYIMSGNIVLMLQILPSRSADINFGASSHLHKRKRMVPRRKPLIQLTEAEQQERLLQLRSVKPDAIVFTAVTSSATSDTDTADEDDELPLSVPSLVDSLDNNDTASLLDYVLFYRPSDQQLHNLSARTVNQSKSAIWSAHRVGRITASHAKSVLDFDSSKISSSVVENICAGSSGFTS